MSTLHFPLYVVEALLVELVAWRMNPNKPLTLGVVAGALIGTVGFAAEWGWSHLWMPLPWPSSIFPEGAILALLAGVAGGILGGFIGRALLANGRQAPQHAPRGLLAAAVVLALVCIAWPLPMDTGAPTSATVALREVAGPPHRAVAATVRLSPPDAGSSAQWLTVTAWQGGGLVVDRLQRVGDGVYRTTQPIPVYGKWKAMLRMENGRAVVASPIFLPADPAIPAKGVPATAHFDAPVRERQVGPAARGARRGGWPPASGLRAAAGHRRRLARRPRVRAAPAAAHRGRAVPRRGARSSGRGRRGTRRAAPRGRRAGVAGRVPGRGSA